MSLAFPKSRRLTSRADYDAIFQARVRQGDSRLLVYARRNTLPYSRLGLSVSRRVGNAVQRNRIKRLVREAFRLQRESLPVGFDWVVVIRPHEPQGLHTYKAALLELTTSLARKPGMNPPKPPAPLTPGNQ